MREIILHGGIGSRMKPLSNEIPKGFIPVLGKSVVERIVDQSNGVTGEKFIIVPKGDIKIGRLIEEKNMPLQVLEARSTHMELVTEVLEQRDEPMIMWWGDTIASLSLPEMIRQHEESQTEASIALWETTMLRELKHWGSITLNENGVTVGHPVPDTSTKGKIKAGIFIFNPSVAKIFRRVSTESWDMSRILNSMTFGKQFLGFIFHGYRICLDYGYDLIRASAMIRECTDYHNPQIDKGVSVSGRTELGNNVTVSEGCEIQDGVHISDSILLPNTRVQKNATIVSSVIGPNTSISEGSLIRRKMITQFEAADISECPY